MVTSTQEDKTLWMPPRAMDLSPETNRNTEGLGSREDPC